MIEKIEVFGQTLEFDEALIRDTKLHIKVRGMASMMATSLKALFNEWGEDVFLKRKEFIDMLVKRRLISIVACIDYCEQNFGISITKDDLLVEESYLQCSLDKFSDFYINSVVAEGITIENFNKSFSQYIEDCARAEFLDVCDMVIPIEKILKRNGADICIITLDDEEKSVRLFEQLKKTKDKNQAYKLAYEMFKTDPTEREYYEYCMINYPEELAGLFSMYKVVGFEVKQDYVESMFRNYYKKMPHKTKRELLQIKNQFDVIQNVIGFFDTDIYKKVEKARIKHEKREQKEKLKQEKLEQQKKDLELKRDLQKRTVYGTVYDSLEDAEKAKAEHNKVDVLKEQLLTTKSQKKRYEIFSKFDMDINNVDAKSRYDQLKERFQQKNLYQKR